MNKEKSTHTDIIAERFSLFKTGERGTDVRKRIKEGGLDLSKTPKLMDLMIEKNGLTDQKINEKMKTNVDDNLLDILLTKKI